LINAPHNKEEVSMSTTPGGSRWRLTLIAVLTFAAALLVAACGDDDDGGGGGGGGGGDGYTMTLIAGVRGDEFYITMNCGAQEEARKQGVELDFQGPDQFDASLQTPIVNAVTQKKPDAILIAPTDTKALYVPIKQAADAGIKIVLVDTTLEQADLAVSQIASDNIGGGREAAKALADLIGGGGKVFVNNVNPGISTTDLRAQGFEEEAKKLGLDYLGQQYNDDDPAKAAAITKAQLAKNPDLKGIFATNLFSAEGSASGLREADKLGDVKIVGFDAGPKQIEDLKGGLVQALVAQRPAEIGKLGVQQAVAALDGKPTKKEIGTGFVTLTKDNLKENPDIPYKSSC
jgi:ribose transport system substrate-binding protein